MTLCENLEDNSASTIIKILSENLWVPQDPSNVYVRGNVHSPE